MVAREKPRLKKIPKSYCDVVAHLGESNVHRLYHDNQYGFPIDSDNELFGRLILEINQAGLSWTTILNKQKHFRKAYSAFDVQQVARYAEEQKQRLLSDAGIVRNRRKVNAAVYNAQQIIRIQKECGSFKSWLDCHHPLTLEDWVRLFKATFTFTGGEITKEFLTSTGYLQGAHRKNCPVFDKVLRQKPMWSIQTKRT